MYLSIYHMATGTTFYVQTFVWRFELPDIGEPVCTVRHMRNTGDNFKLHVISVVFQNVLF